MGLSRKHARHKSRRRQVPIAKSVQTRGSSFYSDHSICTRSAPTRRIKVVLSFRCTRTTRPAAHTAVPDAITNITVDDNNPDAARGTSSYQMTWNGNNGHGYFQFDIGCTVHESSPRHSGLRTSAHSVRFYAKGDIPNRHAQGACVPTDIVQCCATFASQWFRSQRLGGLCVGYFFLTACDRKTCTRCSSLWIRPTTLVGEPFCWMK